VKVALYIGQLDVGGAEGQVVLLARGLLARGHDVLLVTEEGRTAAVPEELEVRLARIPPRPRWRRFVRLEEALAAFRPDVLHCQLSSANFWGVLAAGRAGSPAVVISFLSTDPWKKQRHLWLDGWLAARARGVWANSREVAARYARVWGKRSAGKIKVIYNGVDTARFNRRRFASRRAAFKKEELRVPPTAPVVIHVGNFFAVKNHAGLLAAFAAAAADRKPRSRPYLVLCGDGPEKRNILATASALGILPYLRLVGRVPDAERYLGAADVFVLPSRAEGFSNALLEAMASSLACVATDVGGNAEALADGAGVIVPAGDEGALAAALAGLLDDEDERRRLGTAARRRAEGAFGLARMVDETEKWYRELLEAR